MSDFLTRLVLLNRGEADVVKPRLPGRYAPLPEAGPEEFGGGEMEQPRERAGASAEPSRPLVRSRGADPAPGESALPVRSNLPGEPAPRPAAPEARQEPLRPAAGEKSSGDHPSESVAPDGGGHQTDHSQERIERSVPDAHDVMTAEKPGRHRSETRSPLPARDIEPRPDVAPASAASDRPATRSPAPLVRGRAARPGEPGRPPTLLPAAGEREPRREPSVHVTIGRVEVRAHTAAQQPAARKRGPDRASSLSLHDYLKRGGSHGGRT